MTSEPVICSRRALLGGAFGAALVLAGCDATDPGPPAAGPPPTAGPPTAGPTPTSPAPPGALVALDDLPVGGGAIVPGPLLVVRPAAKTVKAYDAVCPHQRVTIGTPDATGTITCPGHGARFSAADGSRVSGPAPGNLVPVAVEVRDGFVMRT